MKYAQRGCGCYVSGVGKVPAIEFCAKHAAASELLEALKELLAAENEPFGDQKFPEAAKKARAAISKAERKED